MEAPPLEELVLEHLPELPEARQVAERLGGPVPRAGSRPFFCGEPPFREPPFDDDDDDDDDVGDDDDDDDDDNDDD